MHKNGIKTKINIEDSSENNSKKLFQQSSSEINLNKDAIKIEKEDEEQERLDKIKKTKFDFIPIEIQYVSNSILTRRLSRNESLLMEAVEKKEIGEILPFFQRIKEITKETKIVGEHKFEVLFRYRYNPKDKIETPEMLKNINDEVSDKVLIELMEKTFIEIHKSNLQEKMVVSFNFNKKNLMSKEIKQTIKILINKYNIIPDNIIIEILEDVECSEILLEHLKKYKKIGVRIALDDFGEFHSNKENIIRYFDAGVLDIVKIDRIYFNDHKYSLKFEQEIKEILELGVETIVEGIESAEDIFYLKHLGINYIQGYYFHQPENYKSAIDSTSNGNFEDSNNDLSHL